MPFTAPTPGCPTARGSRRLLPRDFNTPKCWLRSSCRRTKLTHYEACQDLFWHWWKDQDARGARPYFRAVFLTRSQDRANHILWLARESARNADRHLVYATTQDAFLSEPRALHAPLLLDHHRSWQALVNLHPTADYQRTPVPLTRPVTTLPSVL